MTARRDRLPDLGSLRGSFELCCDVDIARQPRRNTIIAPVNILPAADEQRKHPASVIGRR